MQEAAAHERERRDWPRREKMGHMLGEFDQSPCHLVLWCNNTCTFIYIYITIYFIYLLFIIEELLYI